MTEKNYLFVNFMIQDGKDIKVNLEDQKITFSGTSGADDTEYDNEIEFYAKIVKADSQTKQYDRKVHCFMGKSKRAEAWPRLTKDPAKTMKEISDKNKVVPSMDDLDDDLEEGGGVTASKQDGVVVTAGCT
uniref:prostaglandin E synthase 3-like isoform X3 n=1 Tax=Myxine glutinosa TaxID=7769 RepID=UPI00358E00B6